MKTFVFGGSFNPFTNGHLDIVKQALPLCDRFYIVIADNLSKVKGNSNYLSSKLKSNLEELEKIKQIENVFDNNCLTDKIHIIYLSDTKFKTLAECCKSVNGTLVRGIRNTIDFEYEKQMANINRTFGVETIFFFPHPNDEGIDISRSMVRELVKLGKDVSKYVPESVNKNLKTIKY